MYSVIALSHATSFDRYMYEWLRHVFFFFFFFFNLFGCNILGESTVSTATVALIWTWNIAVADYFNAWQLNVSADYYNLRLWNVAPNGYYHERQLKVALFTITVYGHLMNLLLTITMQDIAAADYYSVMGM